MKLALCDEHQLFRKGLRQLIEDFSIDAIIIWEAENGHNAISNMESGLIPDILLIDASIPVINGEETMACIQSRFPGIKVFVLCMMEDEVGILYLLRQGVRGF